MKRAKKAAKKRPGRPQALTPDGKITLDALKRARNL